MKTGSIFSYLTTCAIVSFNIATFYAVMQQMYCTTIEPQIQRAYDLKEQLEQNKKAEYLLPDDTLDLQNGLEGFIALFNKEGKPIRSNDFLNNKMSQLPKEVYDFSKINKEKRITWQPQTGIRMAAVILSVNHPEIKFIAVGRSLKEAEEREANFQYCSFNLANMFFYCPPW